MSPIHGTKSVRRSSCPQADQQQPHKLAQEQDNGKLGPLEIPEILGMISAYLDQRSLARCLRVSRLWHSHFLPYLWSELHLEPPGGHAAMPVYRPIKENAQYVRRLYVMGDIGTKLRTYVTCPHLHYLRITQALQPKTQYSSHALIRRHQESLTFLSINEETSRRLLDTITRCSKLQRLILRSLKLTEPDQWISLYDDLWSRLRVLHLHGNWFSPKTTLQLSPTIPSEETTASTYLSRPAAIEELHITGQSVSETALEAHIWVIKQCPRLTRLRWTSTWYTYEREPMLWLADAIRSGSTWPRLESLDLSDQKYQVVDFATVVEALPRLKELRLSGTNFGQGSWATLQQHSRLLNGLRVLSVEGEHLRGPTAQEILCSMPNLEIFKGSVLSDFDILCDDRPWVCQRLRELTISIELESRSSQPMILARIAALSRLEVVELFNRTRDSKKVLHLTVKDGLNQLKTLSRLRAFRGPLDKFMFEWSPEDIRWVVENWPRLRWLSGVKLVGGSEGALKRITHYNSYVYF
ncbi:hypothetical protein BGZ83_009677 [Gryganskiella cystojenkinii]|nr:hypothetical protein BGZ83_009677 [Gryganskiella cystojenkinii]